MIVTFCGHGNIIYGTTVIQELYRVIEELISNGAKEFFIGGYGNFDILSGEIVNSLKTKYPYIKSVLVIPYLNRNYNLSMFDSTIYPPLENIPPKFSIIKRNEWMVKNSDVVVCYVMNDWGGASKMFKYAIKNKKPTINIYDKLNFQYRGK